MAINDPGRAQPSNSTGGFLNAVGMAVSAGLSAEAIAQATQAAQGLGNAAAAGQIQITPEGFDILTKTLDQCENHLQTLQDQVNWVTQAPQLGTSPYAQTVAAHVQKGGTGLDQSADMMVQQLGPVFDAIRDALSKAKQAYEDNEHANVRKLK